MELRQLAYFVAVADEGGFGRAAERLHIVQPAVSQQVGRLERELGAPLFDRSKRQVRLTEAGQRLLPEARAVLAAADRARRAVTGSADATTLRIGVSRAPGQRLYAMLERLAPALRVRLIKMEKPAERLAAVRSGELDAALVRLVEAAPGLELFPAWTDPLVVALPAGHPLAAQPQVRLEQLGDLPVRLAPRENNPAFHDLVTGSLAEAGVRPPRGPEFTGLHDTLVDLASGPPSWTLFYPVFDDLPPVRGVAYVPLAGPEAPTYAAVPPGPPSAQVRQLLEALR
ncbi:LysR family transcriptional regulator [Nonomuraea zeae]|uniref:LysR family transcriptional regulator n=1 Tax=Nonomuraea zeae TaxID=1642303 RepID=A0A5S4GDM4_9ACTN|nr:LysR family transcriptional regulator [Nonomuraea zeae]TMR31103.1 LysR family transcriptional regulator [Nonomuraea zeae]